MSQFTQQVNTGMNDAYEVISLSLWWNALNVIVMGNNVIGFFRFTLTGIGQGSTISSAYFSVVCDWGGANPLNLKVRAIDEDDTADFTNDATGRSRTSAGVDWDIPAWSHGDTKTTPDIKSVIQEVIDRPGYSGGAIAIVIENDGSEFNNSAHSYEGDSGEAASIVINYTGITTHYKTTTSIAKILNPPFDMGIIVTKPTYDVLTDKDPTHHIFNSDYPTLKYYAVGSVQVDLPAGDWAAAGSVEHNLGYEPYVEVYSKTETAGKYQYCPYSGAGATVFYGSTFRITSTHIYFYLESTGFAEATSWHFKYFIFRNDTDF